MSVKKEIVKKGLPYYKLNNKCDPGMFKFSDTSELEPFTGIIGQERAESAMKFGLRVKTKGYNIFITGITGTGKTSYARECIKNVAAGEKTPDDWCYLYNFENPSQPIAVNLPAGQGIMFKKSMEEFVKNFTRDIKKVFEDEIYDREKTEILRQYQQKKSELFAKLTIDAEKHGLKLKTSSSGIFFMPVVDGKVLSEEEYNQLDEDVKAEITSKIEAIQMETIEIMRKMRNIEKEFEKRIKDWENNIGLSVLNNHMKELKENYSWNNKISTYLEKVKEDILQNLNAFKTMDHDEEKHGILPWLRRGVASLTEKYKVNLFIDNSGLEGAPVIVDFNPNYYNLLGKVEYENELGTITTDYTLIKPGLLHKANGGYLILQAKDVLNNIMSWEALKRVLKTGSINIESLRDQLGFEPVSTLKPDPIPADIKVVLIGSERLYQLLYEFDEDFGKLFKIKVDFDDEMERNEENTLKLAGFISSICRKEGINHFSPSGVAKVVEYSSRLAENQNKLSTRFNELAEIICESAVWARAEGCITVNANHVEKAIREKKYRSDKYDKKLLQMLKEETLLIDTEGAVVGQINGLSIIDIGDYVFGKPSRITAATYIGERGIVNIEREVKMSGKSHSKGVMILSGYIGQKYASEIPLSLTASLCFEQLYSGVDGDSASSAELYAILSSLAEVPLRQSIAVTGSVNQKGEIQPIGGVTTKIEGFFELCKIRGLNGSHGVIIPYQNIRNLVLNDEVIEAVKAGLFNIYPVRTIDEGIEILTGIEAGEKGEDGQYPEGSINWLVYQKLKKFAYTVAGFGREQSKF